MVCVPFRMKQITGKRTAQFGGDMPLAACILLPQVTPTPAPRRMIWFFSAHREYHITNPAYSSVGDSYDGYLGEAFPLISDAQHATASQCGCSFVPLQVLECVLKAPHVDRLGDSAPRLYWFPGMQASLMRPSMLSVLRAILGKSLRHFGVTYLCWSLCQFYHSSQYCSAAIDRFTKN